MLPSYDQGEPDMRIAGHRKQIFKGSIAMGALIAFSQAVPAYAQQQTYSFDIPAQNLGSALREFARVARQQVTFDAAAVRGKHAPALRGSYTAEQALERLLSGSGLEAQRGRSGLFIVRPIVPASERDAASGEAFAGSGAPEGGIVEAESITVTGTRIRGVRPTAPVAVITQEDMRSSGHNDLGEAIRALPQNFSGGQNPGVLLGATAGGIANQNITGGSGFNLRGLGPDASLTLLNGMRLPYDGGVQASDVTAIPIAAIDRIEILLDGASAIYGSDAVAGVANIILRRDYEGAEVSARFGTSTAGGYDNDQYSAVAGHVWGSGGLLVAGDLSHNDPIRASDRDYTAHIPVQSVMLYPESRRRSALLSAHQQIGSVIELEIDAFYTDRRTDTLNSTTATFADRTNAEIWGVSPRVNVSLPNDWRLRLHGFTGQNDAETDRETFSIATGMPTGQSGTGYRNRAQAAGIEAEGPLFALPGGDARLSVGGGWRRNSFARVNLITGAPTIDGASSSYYAYGEVSLPLIAEGQDIPLMDRLLVNAALRYENYNSFAETATPKIGVLWSVVSGLEVRASWGRSFKAPTLLQQNQDQLIYLYPSALLGGAGAGAPANSQTILLLGGNPDLGPETAETISVGLVVKPRSIAGLQLDVNWFQIDYTNRVVQPIGAFPLALVDPANAEAVTLNPSAAQIASAFAFAGRPDGSFTLNYAGVPYAPGDVFAIVNNAYVNAASDLVRGLDLSVRYGMDAGRGRISLSANANWILDAERRASSTSPTAPTAGVNFFPAEFKARLGASWSGQGITMAANLNHIGGIADTNVTPSIERGSMTTLDLVLDYRVEAPLLGDIGFNLAVLDVFDRAPPFMQAIQPFYANFDSTNYSPLGRVVSLRLTKSF